MKLDLLLDNLKSIEVSKLDDAVDRLHYLQSTILLVFFVFVIGFQQTYKEPLTCSLPANFPPTWIEYMNNYCYISGTFHTQDGNNFKDGKVFHYLNYYQWVPYVMAAQALSFYLPHLLYLLMAKSLASGLNVRQIVDRCHAASGKSSEERNKEVKEVARMIYDSTTLEHDIGKYGKPKPLGRKLVFSYLLVKLFNLLNLLLNIYLLNLFVGDGDSFWAFKIVKNALGGQYWTETGLFPRVTYCEVEFKRPVDMLKHRVQCLLMINILTEKVYVLLYFWFLALVIPTVLNLVYAIYELLIDSHPRAYVISEPFFTSKNITRKEQHRVFSKNYLSSDGRLLVRFIEDHAGPVVASHLLDELVQLWDPK